LASSDVEAFTRRLEHLPRSLAEARTKGLRAGAAAGKEAFLGTPGAPKRVAKKPLTVSTKVTETQAIIKWGQAARLVNDPTRPHFIRPRGSGAARDQYRRAAKGSLSKSVKGMALVAFLGVVSGNQQTGLGAGIGHAINIRGVGPRAYAHHPGTKGKPFVTRSKERAHPVITQAYRREHTAALGQSLKR
jgi:hypothetical protein